jgi:hypothetical protein
VKGSGFDPEKDAMQRVNVIETAKKLNSTVEMGDDEFREMLKTLFPNLPSYHVNDIVKLVKKKERKERQIDRLTRLTGGLI